MAHSVLCVVVTPGSPGLGVTVTRDPATGETGGRGARGVLANERRVLRVLTNQEIGESAPSRAQPSIGDKISTETLNYHTYLETDNISPSCCLNAILNLNLDIL